MGLPGRLLPFLALLGAAVTSPAQGPANHPRAATTLTNPVLWEDYPDLDVFRVGDVFYYSSSTFAYSPGAPVLKSYDLAHWTPVSHSVPMLNFGSQYNLTGNSAYVKGIWASTLRYRKSNDQFYWYGCVDFSKTYIWTSAGSNAAANNGEVSKWNWQSHPPINTCYYDCGLLIDDDDSMYISYGNPTINVAKLSADGLSQVSTKAVFTPPSGTTFEGSRMYKVNGSYYIFVTRPSNAEYVLKSSGGPFGPYTSKVLVNSIGGPLNNAGFSHQGGIVGTQDGKFYYTAFMDSYPSGRIPVVAPIKWTSDGWPQVVTDSSGRWGTSYPIPVQTSKTLPDNGNGGTGVDDFSGSELSAHWEWNHNPDPSKYKLDGGLLLNTATVTSDLFAARNTLTHRILGPKSSGTFRLDVSKMADGDRAGAVLFRDQSAYIGVWKSGSTTQVLLYTGMALNTNGWKTQSTGSKSATGPTLTNTSDVWFRIEADVTPSFGTSQSRSATFSYSTDGKTFTKLGSPVSLSNSWNYFTGYRFGVFNHATKALGGQVKVKSFEMQPL